MTRQISRRNSLCWLLLAATGVFHSSPHARAGELELDGHPFILAEGFSMERAAGPELVERPITANFDELGRLYVSESSGTNDPVKQQVVDRPHRILRLEDTNHDGIFDTRTVYAENFTCAPRPRSGNSQTPITTAWPIAARSGSTPKP